MIVKNDMAFWYWSARNTFQIVYYLVVIKQTQEYGSTLIDFYIIIITAAAISTSTCHMTTYVHGTRTLPERNACLTEGLLSR